MDQSLAKTAKNLATHIAALRRQRGLSQAQLAKLAEIPRSTLTYMESGEGNPSLQNLLRISKALQISLEELLSPPREEVKLIPKDEVEVLVKSKGGAQIHKLLPEPIPGMEIDRFVLEPGARFRGTPHLAKTKEYLYCASGKIAIYVQGRRWEVEKGSVLAFPGDEPHAYENLDARRKAEAFSVVVLAI